MPKFNLNESPKIFNSFWEKQRGGVDTIFDPVKYNEYPEYSDRKLFHSIRKLHSLENNAITNGRKILLGYGCSHLITVVIWVHLIYYNVNVLFAQSPFYYRYKKIYPFFKALKPDLIWTDDLTEAKELKKSGKIILEFVTSPNNPDSTIRKKMIGDYCFYDAVYNWSFYTSHVQIYDEDIVLYSASKAVGMAGQRIGWALIKDINFYKRCLDIIKFTTDFISLISREQVRRGIDYVVQTYPIFQTYMTNKYKKRWNSIEKLTIYLNNYLPITLVNHDGPYALLKTSHNVNLEKYLQQKIGINTKSAVIFGLDKRSVRINPGGSDKTFKRLDLFLNKSSITP